MEFSDICNLNDNGDNIYALRLDYLMTSFIYSNASETEKEAYRVGANHNLNASQGTLKLIKNMEDNQNLVVKMLESFQEETRQAFKDSDRRNCEQHNEIIKRQDHTNGSIAEANIKIAQVSRKQLVLRIILGTVAVMLMILGFMPERLYELLKLAV